MDTPSTPAKAKKTFWTETKLRGLKVPPPKKPGARPKTEHRHLIEERLYLFVRMSADGKEVRRQWQYRVQVNGRRKWLSLGSFPEIGLSEARDKLTGHDKVRQAARMGEEDHPVTKAKLERKSAKGNPTVAEAWEDMIAAKRVSSRWKDGKPVRERTIYLMYQSYNNDIKPVIGQSLVSKLTPTMMKMCLKRPLERKAPGAAALVYKYMKEFSNWAIAEELITGADPMRGVNNPKPYRPKKPNAAPDDHLAELLAAIDAGGMSTSMRYALELEMLTGMRPGEVRLLTWKQVRLDRQALYLTGDDTKTDEPIKIHLSKAAVKLLQKAKLAAGASEFVFPGRQMEGREDAPLAGTSAAQALRRKYNGALADSEKRYRPYDLRKTFRTMCTRLDIPREIAEHCINHKDPDLLVRVYDGEDPWDKLVKAWDTIGAHIAKVRRTLVPQFAAALAAGRDGKEPALVPAGEVLRIPTIAPRLKVVAGGRKSRK